MSNIINEMANRIYSYTWKKKDYFDLQDRWLDFFRENGEGFYYTNLIGLPDDPVSSLITYFSGPFSHSVMLYYSEDIFRKFNVEQRDRIWYKYNDYYKNPGPEFPVNDKFDNTKVMVLGSADKIGMNYFDFSSYQNRQQIICKLPDMTPQETRNMLDYLTRKDLMEADYDVTGLVFWAERLADDHKSWYCSELVYDVIKNTTGISITFDENPSPTMIAKASVQAQNQVFNNSDHFITV